MDEFAKQNKVDTNLVALGRHKMTLSTQKKNNDINEYAGVLAELKYLINNI